ncbi:uncharacterized protein G6M90_00g078160 [Metarhizium brunneum]|uniref:Uncharacterized protein n=1 Tax=Metarhizium brunneum TaxID=500148 RepID=A0A7D5Z9X1_9HYPO|nr:hypothetical protein G6M90_00g078160 [Metarhizium brunneum]
MALVLGLDQRHRPPPHLRLIFILGSLDAKMLNQHVNGYISGVEAESLTCDDGYWCHVNTVSSLFGCCSSDCVLVSECIPYSSSSETATVTTGDLGVIYCIHLRYIWYRRKRLWQWHWCVCEEDPWDVSDNQSGFYELTFNHSHNCSPDYNYFKTVKWR